MKPIAIYFIISDLLLYNICYFVTIFLLNKVWWIDGNGYPFLLLISNLLLLLAFFISNQHKISEKIHIFQLFYDNVLYLSVFLFLLFSIWILAFAPKLEVIHLIFIISIFFFLDIFLKKIIINYFRNSILTHEGIRKSYLIGNDTISIEFEKELIDNQWLGYSIEKKLKVFSVDSFEIIENDIAEKSIQSIFINSSTTVLNETSVNFLKKLHENYMIDIKLFSEQFSNKLKRSSYELFGHIPVINMFSYELDSSFNRNIKRFFDIIFTLILFVILLSWLLPLIAILIKFTSAGNVFYIHKRIGIHGKPFNCFKFRTMYSNFSNEPFQQTIKNDSRITPLGKFLRKYNLDEFPQFINVLMGDISIVGPRPMVIEHMKEYDNDIKEIYSRHWIKPGITGLAQVSGYRGEVDSPEKMKGRIRLDRYYLNNWSFFMDIKIIWWTFRNMIKGDEFAI